MAELAGLAACVEGHKFWLAAFANRIAKERGCLFLETCEEVVRHHTCLSEESSAWSSLVSLFVKKHEDGVTASSSPTTVTIASMRPTSPVDDQHARGAEASEHGAAVPGASSISTTEGLRSDATRTRTADGGPNVDTQPDAPSPTSTAVMSPPTGTAADVAVSSTSPSSTKSPLPLVKPFSAARKTLVVPFSTTTGTTGIAGGSVGAAGASTRGDGLSHSPEIKSRKVLPPVTSTTVATTASPPSEVATCSSPAGKLQHIEPPPPRPAKRRTSIVAPLKELEARQAELYRSLLTPLAPGVSPSSIVASSSAAVAGGEDQSLPSQMNPIPTKVTLSPVRQRLAESPLADSSPGAVAKVQRSLRA